MTYSCPVDESKARCLETRTHARGTRRRYECRKCRLRWTTVETMGTSYEGILEAERARLVTLMQEGEEALVNALKLLRKEAL